MKRCGNPECNTSFAPKSICHGFCNAKCRAAARGRAYRRLRKLALRRDAFICQDCASQRNRLECHHLTPLCMGGTNVLDNLLTLCVRCHRKRHKSWRAYTNVTNTEEDTARATPRYKAA